MDTEDEFVIGGTTFGFSGASIGELGSSEYTLVVVAVDTSLSVKDFESEISDCVRQVVETCRNSPRADSLMIRVVEFDRSVRETHGFKELMNCNSGDYTFKCDGTSTSLFDAAYTGIGSVFEYGKKLYAEEYTSNAVTFIITDGWDNSSSMSAAAVGQLVEEARNTECALESLLTILIGVNIDNQMVSRSLQNFEKEGRFDMYVEIGEANKDNLTKLANFASQLVSSTSQALGTGGPSKQIPSLSI